MHQETTHLEVFSERRDSSREGRNEIEVHSLIPQAECHLSWVDLCRRFDVFHSYPCKRGSV